MSSRKRANRINAYRSTGPRTLKGKARSAHNAFRHGLAVPVLALPIYSSAVEEISSILVGENTEVGRRELARRVAEVLVDLRRIRAVKFSLLEQLDGAVSIQRIERATEQPAAVIDLFRCLERLDRYERGALSRHKLAARDLSSALRTTSN